ncbi:hypothetical protein K437DRAFT_256742 [Tilletiaria anomala UBC 951]|uniref:BZIP domain-containing protein n=1 Tax=Tilletiaria anomala (strain ATCC 24038 / CBS 436.72 / UBC 951) TaxID=1037660 RepID=A0A066W1X7_TILAU|nr:uncharacterized protein K437DRAFT_256742 [Tilletiaria anomala UBC 951]KDN45084.1 hypothetical protein K437DRAFT_256742 [Tilletiaria anomala UBC 951]
MNALQDSRFQQQGAAAAAAGGGGSGSGPLSGARDSRTAPSVEQAEQQHVEAQLKGHAQPFQPHAPGQGHHFPPHHHHQQQRHALGHGDQQHQGDAADSSWYTQSMPPENWRSSSDVRDAENSAAAVALAAAAAEASRHAHTHGHGQAQGPADPDNQGQGQDRRGTGPPPPPPLEYYSQEPGVPDSAQVPCAEGSTVAGAGAAGPAAGNGTAADRDASVPTCDAADLINTADGQAVSGKRKRGIRDVDPSKRAAQNRAAQKRFREKRDEKYRRLEEAQQTFDALKAARDELATQLTSFAAEREELRARILAAEMIASDLRAESTQLRAALDGEVEAVYTQLREENMNLKGALRAFAGGNGQVQAQIQHSGLPGATNAVIAGNSTNAPEGASATGSSSGNPEGIEQILQQYHIPYPGFTPSAPAADAPGMTTDPTGATASATNTTDTSLQPPGQSLTSAPDEKSAPAPAASGSQPAGGTSLVPGLGTRAGPLDHLVTAAASAPRADTSTTAGAGRRQTRGSTTTATAL